MKQRWGLTGGFTAAMGAVLMGMGSMGRSQTIPEAQPPDQFLSLPTTEQVLPHSSATEANRSRPSHSLTCPVGQFPSAFPDVSPDYWAYEAVNRLASHPVQCFNAPKIRGLNLSDS